MAAWKEKGFLNESQTRERAEGSFRHGRVLVTGGAGFIGSHLVRRLVSEDCTVISLGSNLDAAEKATLIRGLPVVNVITIQREAF